MSKYKLRQRPKSNRFGMRVTRLITRMETRLKTHFDLQLKMDILMLELMIERGKKCKNQWTS